VASIPPKGGRKHPHQDLIQIDTTNILFICGGAFDGLEKIIGQRVNASSLGFGANIHSKLSFENRNVLSEVTTEDLIKFGIIPEFVGRFPVVGALEPLSVENLVSILVEPKNALVKQYQKLFELEGANLTFSDGALRRIAEMAYVERTGARALRSVIEKLMLDLMYDLPALVTTQKDFLIDEEMVNRVDTEHLTAFGTLKKTA
jgi:ATP-dependent Clp protease ATP-binding subunit ClpX